MGPSRLDAATIGLLLFVASCSFAPGSAGQGAPSIGSGGVSGSAGTSGGSGLTGGPTGVGGANGSDVTVTGSGGTGTSCGQMNVAIMPVPPDILIVQDKSSSMSNDDSDKGCGNGGCGAGSKWSQVTAALTQVVAGTQTSINWGLKFFSDNGACDASAPPIVAVGPGNGAAIANAIAANGPGGNTPTRDAITNGGTYLAGLTDTNPKYLLLATDGLPNCPVGCSGMARPSSSCTMTDNPNEDMAAEQAVLAAAGQGFKTFVIGIGNVSTAVATLDAMAVSGGEAQAGGATRYYAATDPAALESALNAIVGVVASCTISLATAPTGFTNVAISATNASGNVVEIPNDASNGWSYGSNP